MSKKQKNLFLGLILVLVSSLVVFFSSYSNKYTSFNNKKLEPSSDVYENEVLRATVFPTPVNLKLSEKSNISTQSSISENSNIQNKSYRVVKVVDGDTLDVDIDGKVERLRLIGIDTPETVDPRRSVQCFGKEASNKAKELLNGSFVALESDKTQGERDKYKRLLRYVFLLDGTNFNLYMISEGFAHEYTYYLPYKYQAEFKQAEIDARKSNKGLWNPLTCNGNK